LETAPAPRLSLGKYQLVRHLATGGMAEVLLARVQGIEGFERHVVIKKIRDERARDERFVQMFLDEARLAASLHHNNIVHVHDIGQDQGEYFFTMEYVHGEDLRRILAHMAQHERLVPIDQCVTIALATAAALHHAHEHRRADRNFAGIVHRDVSPANILVAFDGSVKVVDFGIAKLAQRTEETGLMKGKVAYMSPEQCLGHDVDRRSDIFCLGIVLYELLTVRRLFKGTNDFLTMSSILHGRIPRPSEIRPDVPRELESIILQALASRPEDRYQTAGEMRAALERFAANAKLQTSTTALADFMRAQFGERDVPWMVEEDEPEVSIDFDGSMTGVVPAPAEALAAQEVGVTTPRRIPRGTTGPNAEESLALRASSPELRASSPNLRASSPELLRASTPDLPASRAASVGSFEAPPPPRRRRRLLIAAAGATTGVIAAAVLALMSRAPEKSAPASSASAPVLVPSAEPPAPTPAPTPPPAPITPPNLVPSAPDPAPAQPVLEAEPPGSASPGAGAAPAPGSPESPPAAAEATSTEKKPARPGKRPAAAKKPPKGVWDPKALLPPK
jgi:serine/threonine-protein kinase